MKSNEWIVGVMLGAFFLLGAANTGDWFRVPWLEKSIGRGAARAAYGLLGVVLIAISLTLSR